mmetsp:Transcript_9682/g.21620  ORF Transcript_9682/g.21620 Transcript_9682/m.21620 type:complete len:212 (-) Transcript_9682:1546-2181(-)
MLSRNSFASSPVTSSSLSKKFNMFASACFLLTSNTSLMCSMVPSSTPQSALSSRIRATTASKRSTSLDAKASSKPCLASLIRLLTVLRTDLALVSPLSCSAFAWSNSSTKVSSTSTKFGAFVALSVTFWSCRAASAARSMIYSLFMTARFAFSLAPWSASLRRALSFGVTYLTSGQPLFQIPFFNSWKRAISASFFLRLSLASSIAADTSW